MALTGISSLSTSETTAKVVDAGYDNSQMAQEDFLKVLLADMQWQNPLEAKDVGEFINNSIKLREMEVMNTFEKSVTALQGSDASNELLQASGLIGRTVTYEGDSTVVKAGKGYSEFTLASAADYVSVTLYDGDGKQVDSMVFSGLSGGATYPFEIDDTSLDDGYYTVRVEAMHGGESVAATVRSRAVVEGISRQDGSLSAYFNNEDIDLNSISQIGA